MKRGIDSRVPKAKIPRKYVAEYMANDFSYLDRIRMRIGERIMNMIKETTTRAILGKSYGKIPEALAFVRRLWMPF